MSLLSMKQLPVVGKKSMCKGANVHYAVNAAPVGLKEKKNSLDQN